MRITLVYALLKGIILYICTYIYIDTTKNAYGLHVRIIFIRVCRSIGTNPTAGQKATN